LTPTTSPSKRLVTRFSPTIYAEKEIHLGHLLSLAITRRWAAENNAEFFYLIEIPAMAKMPIWGIDVIEPKMKHTMEFMGYWASHLNHNVVRQIALLQQLVPAKVRIAICQTVQDIDKAMGTTHVFRGRHCPGTSIPDGVVEYRLPMLIHDVFGYVNMWTEAGRFNLRVLAARFGGQHSAFAACLHYFWREMGITEAPLDIERITNKESLRLHVEIFERWPNAIDISSQSHLSSETQLYALTHRMLKI